MKNISKILITQDYGRRVGYVLDVAVDFDTMQKVGYYVVDEESESEFLLENKDIMAFSSEFLLISSASSLQFIAMRPKLFGKQILDEKGNDYGTLKSLEFDRNRCKKFVTDKCEIPSKNIKFVGEDVIFAKFGRKKRQKVANFSFKSQNDVIVRVQEKQSEPHKIEKVVLSANFYVGKTSTQDIFGYNNEKIVGKGQVITQAVVMKAKQHNKLNQLFFALKR